MNRTAQYLFGREELPDTVFLYPGAYSPDRSNSFLSIFDSNTEIKGSWLPFSYTVYKGTEYMVIFNIFGASITLDALQLMKKCNVKKVIFIGLMYSKNLDVGTHVIVNTVFDQAGIVLLDTEGKDVIKVDISNINRQKEAYEQMGIQYQEACIVSVPSVVHGIKQVEEYIEQEHIQGLELEMSTLHHFGNKIGLEIYSFQVVSDNPEHSLFDRSKSISQLRIEGRNLAGYVALKMLEI